jgi:DNA polymerase III subunit gamma/tau
LDETSESAPYRVLARKYRPETFADLIGQEAMVHTLRNSFETNRIAHAFVLTGVRGVGKTTTARILAKGLNCTGPNGAGGPTIDPCGICDNCRSISAGRHVDVFEMDAASRTGVGDIREIIDSVAFRAASALYKVYIIDEVHMLSISAFNALLKTLEEPPEHVKFIFATTEIRKVPVTVLSRCQRFDLRRIEPETMIDYLSGVAAKEKALIAHDALALITRAGDGSVRDSLSLLDQAIAHGAGETTVEQVRAMLGLADRGRVLDLFELVMAGKAREALDELSAQYAAGVDPLAVLRDLAEVTHWVSMVRISPDAADDPTIGPDERARGLAFASGLGMRVLTRTWQMLLKALEEVATAPNAMMATEMAIIRLAHVADLPSPEDLVRRLQGEASAPAAPSQPGPVDGGGRRRAQIDTGRPGAAAAVSQPLVASHLPNAPAPSALQRYATFDDVVALVRARRDMSLLMEVEGSLRLASYTPGRIEFEPADEAEPDLAARLGQKLRLWTGVRWAVSVVGSGGAPTIAEDRAARRGNLLTQAKAHPFVQAALAAFPGASVKDVRPALEVQGEGPDAVRNRLDAELEQQDDDWDPFDPLSEEM